MPPVEDGLAQFHPCHFDKEACKASHCPYCQENKRSFVHMAQLLSRIVLGKIIGPFKQQKTIPWKELSSVFKEKTLE